MDRVQALHRGVGVYTGKCCRSSYGVLCRLPYHPVRHRGEKVIKDELDGMKWAEGQIDWLIKEVISTVYKDEWPLTMNIG